MIPEWGDWEPCTCFLHMISASLKNYILMQGSLAEWLKILHVRKRSRKLAFLMCAVPFIERNSRFVLQHTGAHKRGGGRGPQHTVQNSDYIAFQIWIDRVPPVYIYMYSTLHKSVRPRKKLLQTFKEGSDRDFFPSSVPKRFFVLPIEKKLLLHASPFIKNFN